MINLNKRRWWRHWRWLGIIVPGLLVWWWLIQPKPPALVARHLLGRLTADSSYRALDAGAIWDDDQGVIHAVRWDSLLLWTMNPRLKDGDNTQNFVENTLVSPDLRWVALLDENQVPTPCMHCWHDGHLQDVVPLPIRKDDASCHSSMIDNGGGIYYLTDTQLLRIEGASIIARGTLPAAIRKADDRELSPDGKALIAVTSPFWTYYSVQVAGSDVQLNPTYSTQVSPPMLASSNFDIVAHDAVLFKDGTRFNAHGQVTGPDGWRANRSFYVDRPFTGALAQTHDSLSRVLTTATGSYWTIPAKDARVVGLSADGRYAVTVRSSWLWIGKDHGLSSMIRQVADRWPWFGKVCGSSRYHHIFALYERPGYLRAQSVSWYDSFNQLPGLPLPHEVTDCSDPILSPDGHTLHILAKCTDGKDERLVILDYRW